LTLYALNLRYLDIFLGLVILLDALKGDNDYTFTL